MLLNLCHGIFSNMYFAKFSSTNYQLINRNLTTDRGEKSLELLPNSKAYSNLHTSVTSSINVFVYFITKKYIFLIYIFFKLLLQIINSLLTNVKVWIPFYRIMSKILSKNLINHYPLINFC